MNRKLFGLIFSLLLLLLFYPSVASAGLFGSVFHSSTSNASSSSGSTNPLNIQSKLLSKYVFANKNVLLSQSKLAMAVGLKKNSEQLAAEARSLKGGATVNQLKKTNKNISKSTKNYLSILNNKKTVISSKSKVDFGLGLAYLGKGLLNYISMKNSVTSFSSAVSHLSPITMAEESSKLKAGLYIAKSLPNSIKNLGSTLKESVDYAHSHNIPVPKDATNALGSL
jgi:hypothetical protein